LLILHSHVAALPSEPRMLVQAQLRVRSVCLSLGNDREFQMPFGVVGRVLDGIHQPARGKGQIFRRNRTGKLNYRELSRYCCVEIIIVMIITVRRRQYRGVGFQLLGVVHITISLTSTSSLTTSDELVAGNSVSKTSHFESSSGTLDVDSVERQ